MATQQAAAAPVPAPVKIALIANRDASSGATNNAQPEWKTVGKHGVIKLGPLAMKRWPEYFSCDDLSDPEHVIHSMNKHCDEHDLPKNACVINVCGTLDK